MKINLLSSRVVLGSSKSANADKNEKMMILRLRMRCFLVFLAARDPWDRWLLLLLLRTADRRLKFFQCSLEGRGDDCRMGLYFDFCVFAPVISEATSMY